tara:strand:- start:1637 stop:2230 length:594 start_codon:yes stop_codon:yes gene_type:complete
MLGLTSGLEYSNFNSGETGPYLLVECTDSSLTSGVNSVLIFQNLTSATRSANDTLTASFEYYLTDPDGVDGTDNVTYRFGQGDDDNVVSGTSATIGPFTSKQFQQDVAQARSGLISTCFGNNWTNNYIFALTVTNDKPSFQTKFFIKNFQVVHKNSGGTVLETITFDFSSGGDISMVTGSGAFSPSSAQYSKGNVLP